MGAVLCNPGFANTVATAANTQPEAGQVVVEVDDVCPGHRQAGGGDRLSCELHARVPLLGSAWEAPSCFPVTVCASQRQQNRLASRSKASEMMLPETSRTDLCACLNEA